jgi:hypothetical protein
MHIYKLRDVFTVGGFPSVTYVDRSHLQLEQELRSAVSKGFAIVAVTGPSKSGKTVLCHSVIAENDSVKIDGGQIGSVQEFWGQVLTKLGVAVPASQSEVNGTSAGSKATGTLGAGPIKGSLELSGTQQHQNTLQKSYGADLQTNALHALRSTGKALIIDDFHYIEAQSRKTIVRALKSEVFKGMTVVAISVPYKAFSVIDAEAEMEGRFRHIEIPEWASSDLMQIAVKGKEALNIGIRQALISELADESSGNPLLMQSFCYDACDRAKIERTQDLYTDISEMFSKEEVYISTAKDVGLPIFKKLETGPQSRSSRIDRPFAKGDKGDTYEAILAAIAITGPKKELHYDDIRSALRAVLVDKHPQKHEVTNALKQMVDIAKEMSVENPAIDLDNDTVFIQNPFFRFYLRWMHSPNFLPGKFKAT